MYLYVFNVNLMEQKEPPEPEANLWEVSHTVLHVTE